MALIIENGTGVLGADAYGSVAAAVQYVAGYVCRDSVRAAWDALDEAGKERVIRAGAVRLDTCHYDRWRGRPTTTSQGRFWPMTVPSISCWEVCPDPCASPCDGAPAQPEGDLGLPLAIKHASFEEALVCMADQQAASGTTGTIGALKKVETEACGIKKATEYFAPTEDTIQQLEAAESVDIVAKLLQPYLCPERKGKLGGRLL